MKYSRDIAVASKGFLMGAANVVPGVSGGTMALVTGIYAEIIAALGAITQPSTWKLLFSRQFSAWWKVLHGRFLVALAFGMLVSIITLAKLVTIAFECFPIQTWAFFFGLILASAVFMARGIKGWKISDLFYLASGLALGVYVCLISSSGAEFSAESENFNYPYLFLCGAIAMCTMILPGVSGSLTLMALGEYETVMLAITQLNLPVLFCFAAGCIIGILLFAKLLDLLLKKWEKQTMIVLLGFVLGSLVKVWPWSNIQPGSELHLAGAAIFCLIGVIFICLIEFLSSRKDKSIGV